MFTTSWGLVRKNYRDVETDKRTGDSPCLTVPSRTESSRTFFGQFTLTMMMQNLSRWGIFLKSCRAKENHARGHDWRTAINDEAASFPLPAYLRAALKTLFLALLLQAQPSSCQKCTDNQVTWRTNGKNDTCLPCIKCFSGLEPSLPCGSVAKYGTHLHCVQCRPGTFSTKYGKEQCRACTLCSAGRTVKRNCTTRKNSVCGPCRHGFYESKHVFDCLPCSVCCGDGKDQIVEQCKAEGLARNRQCQARHNDIKPCLPKTTTSTAAVIVNTTSAVTAKQIATPKEKVPPQKNATTKEFGVKTTQVRTQDNEFSIHHERITQIGTTATSTYKKNMHDGNGVGFQRSKDPPSPSNRVGIKVVVTITVCVSLLIIFAIVVKRRRIASLFWWLQCRPVCKSKDTEACYTESTLAEDAVTSRRDILLLRQLKSVSLEAYERVWKRLDKELYDKKNQRGCYKEVAAAFSYKQEDIWELEKELCVPGKGSPSRALLEGLETKKPELTVPEFIQVLKLPHINRDDITEILAAF